MDKRIKHGLSGHPLYHVWRMMVKRCTDPRHEAYPGYGGRGITVCDRWQSPANFIADMGPRPSPQHTLDRIDNDGPYAPENCRWATRVQQSNNSRQNRVLKLQDQSLSMQDWSRETGVSSRTIKSRLAMGWSPERALTQPLRRKSSQFKGVSLCKQTGRWKAAITIAPGKRVHIGRFDTELEAAHAIAVLQAKRHPGVS